ncbi:hypothetical protein AX15_000438 [Amanita polypyramis BW_CC]|nr:hypothetical protein AX15_000438 [Amanita polypyramis BW_CC]
MESDDQLYHTADISGRLYNYPVPAVHPDHVTRTAPSAYYELTPLAGLDLSLPTHYPESSQRDLVQSSSYVAAYDDSSFRVQNYDLRQSGGQFNSNHFYGTPLNLAPPHTLYSPPNIPTQPGPSAIHPEADFYGHFTSRARNMEHYLSDVSFMGQRGSLNDHFAFTRVPNNNAYVQVSVPLAGSAAGPSVHDTCDPIPQYTRNLTPEFSPSQSSPFDLKPTYTRNASAVKASEPTALGSLTKSAAAVDNPQPSHPSPNPPKGSSVHPNSLPPGDSVPPRVTATKKKKSKMHDCEICGKKFPRPSGLRTHMNTHNNVRPYPCTFPGCTRKFAVRSNAKRHLRTHGVIPAPTATTSSPGSSSTVPYVVGFNPPTIVEPSEAETHQMKRGPFTLKWMPPSLSAMMNASKLRTISDVEESDIDEEDDEYDELLVRRASSTEEENVIFRNQQGEKAIKRELNRSGRLALSIPLRPVVPTSPSLPLPTSRCAPLNLPNPLCGGVNYECCARYEERNSFREAGSHPYHPSQVYFH